MSEEWGPWTAYNGEGYLKGVSLGMIVQVKGAVNGRPWLSAPHVVASDVMYSKIVLHPDEELHAYRIRKPKGFEVLEELLEEIPEPVSA